MVCEWEVVGHIGRRRQIVLILVLVEYGLWACAWPLQVSTVPPVLILVLVEYGLWEAERLAAVAEKSSVLILVLVEYGLWAAPSV